MHDTLDQIDVWACSIALPAPLQFGSFTVSARHYTAVRLRTSGGLSADVIGHTRGSPVDVAIADLLAPPLVGTNPFDVSQRCAEFLAATIAMDRGGVIGRGWSLLELAMQGLRAAALDEPVWAMFGGAPRSVTVQLIEGYPLPEEGDDAFAARLIARVHQGYKALKIEGSHYKDWKTLIRRLQQVRAEAGDVRLVVDFAWSWHSARENADLLRALEALAVDWIEDAFPRDALTEYLRAAQITRAPIGCGDEATQIDDLTRLVDGGALDVVRLDATTLGGFSTVLPFVTLMKQRGCRVSLHDHPEVHQHCVLASDAIDHIEVFPVDRPFDVRHQLCTRSIGDRIRNGRFTPDASPGLGIELDMASVRRYSVRHACIGREFGMNTSART